MGHADIQTTMKYLHYEPRKEDADLVARAFATHQAELRRQPRLKTATVDPSQRAEPTPRLSQGERSSARARCHPRRRPPRPAVRSVMQGNRSNGDKARGRLAIGAPSSRSPLPQAPSGHARAYAAVRTSCSRRRRVAVFVDGCFWHRCPEHLTDPRTNSSYWAAKLDRNVARDRRNDAALEAAGWLVVRVWEHESPCRRRRPSRGGASQALAQAVGRTPRQRLESRGHARQPEGADVAPQSAELLSARPGRGLPQAWTVADLAAARQRSR